MQAFFHSHYEYTTAQTDAIIHSPASNMRFFITDIIISSAVANTITIEEDTAPDRILFKFSLAANGGAVLNLKTPVVASADGNDILITSTGTGQLDVTVIGYEEE